MKFLFQVNSPKCWASPIYLKLFRVIFKFFVSKSSHWNRTIHCLQFTTKSNAEKPRGKCTRKTVSISSFYNFDWFYFNKIIFALDKIFPGQNRTVYISEVRFRLLTKELIWEANRVPYIHKQLIVRKEGICCCKFTEELFPFFRVWNFEPD